MKLSFSPAESVAGQHFDVVVVGSGFGSSFFLHELLKRGGKKILIIEWGDYHPHDWQVENRQNSALLKGDTYDTDSDKEWNFTVALGGGTNCWFGQSPRFHPNDFKLKSLYGVGNDWPIDYDELEPYYCEAERVMSISGDPDMAAVCPRSEPFPQPPHLMSSVDKVMKKAHPDTHFVMPTARARVATEQRSACCASLRCNICPQNAKFTAENGLMHVLGHPDVTICLKSQAIHFNQAGNSVQSLVFENEGKPYKVTGDLFVLGANAIHSPALLQRSGMGGGLVGKGLHESYGAHVEVYLDGLDNFDGSTITTGIDYALYDGPFRAQHSAALLYFENRWYHGFRLEKGKWRQTLPIIIVTENLLLPENAVVPGHKGEGKPMITYAGDADYAKKGMDNAIASLPKLLSALPVEDIFYRGLRPTESHLQGTLRMGHDPAESVVDAGMIHHRWRNLVVVGTAVFPTCSCANPSLTAAALSIRAAHRLV